MVDETFYTQEDTNVSIMFSNIWDLIPIHWGSLPSYSALTSILTLHM